MREAPPFPPTGLGEKETLSVFLDWYRDCVVRKVENLDWDAATRRLVPSNTSLLGIVKHLAFVERGWFQRRFRGEDSWRAPYDQRSRVEFLIEPHETVAGVIEFYRAECERSRQIAAAAALDDESVQPDTPHETLRWIMVHMIEETARHAGQADILREQIDGATGE